MDRIVVTVDGLAGSGKTTLATKLAKNLGWIHFSSGMLYRLVGFLALKYRVGVDDVEGLVGLIKTHSLELKAGPDGSSVPILDGKTIGRELFNPDVSEATSQTARHSAVRDALRDAQRVAFYPNNIVAEGRDMGTVIFPDSPLKFFIEASAEVRLERRMKQLYGSQLETGQDTVNTLKKQAEKEITERDARDTNREVSPTVAASDAIIINNSGPTLTQVLQTMYDAVAEREFAEKSRKVSS